MYSRCVLFLTVFTSVHPYVLPATLHYERLPISEQVQKYLTAFGSVNLNSGNISNNWLENSNKIGLGYNPLYGSPVCYTGTCQMEGFTRSIFKLNYLQSAPGTCTQKFIPEQVELDCLPSTTWDASTETISTLEELYQSITNKVEVSASGSIKTALFLYTFSDETHYIIDNIVQKERTVTYTTAQISYVKLSMFEPLLELSDDFRYVIDNLPCCNYDSNTEQYIYEYIFNYFGFTFISNLLLGGIAQEILLIDRESYEIMIEQGYDIENEAKVEFYVSVDATQQSNYDKITHDKFTSEVQEKHTSTLGGDTSITTIEN
ncbi:unnamed protein product [Didymodactylos carnosus]|uniref:MACPF domain-containing protein n=1 Tax=Didymodactylos carnosus TaxID=1234261 RepID=A0A814DZY4_9BILA|nr:unnamed protein product [Didymodactylos carnosus]CAF1163860.1 unnamed protein product [Didymodactylos carnosus]CAF3734174.1 unnamed protein product [Didymodactylos carnosus]CAF3975453.1 unnamed protein product [Didymodactylos carnosus]